MVKGGIVSDAAAIAVRGVNLWKFRWKPTGEPALRVEHPQHKGEFHEMPVYEVSDGEKTVRFAAGEFSSLAWGFYVPEEDGV
ncbi:MAG: hypothetical protein FWD68_16560 [Alphaproteobacteria bacterium]|nr:hypothetical protein [Alphaproteobacteria bacterium]